MTQNEFDKLPDVTALAVIGKSINGDCKFFFQGKWYIRINNKIQRWN